MHAAITDVSYNTGAGCNSGMIRNLKAGKPVAACKSILDWKRAGGKDCSIRSNGCYGVWDRRLKMYPLCNEDAQRLPPGGLGND
jgi:GH24 family phage-related lysozyme (muramidase)